MSTSGRAILCFSSTDWHGVWGSRQQLMSRFAQRGYRVLFVEQMAGLEHFWRYAPLRQRRRLHWRAGLRAVHPNLWLLAPPPLLPGRYYSHTIAKLNAAIAARAIRPHLRHLQIENPLIWCYKPEHSALLRHFCGRPIVYHCIDEFTVGTHGRKKRLIQEQEKTLLRRADIVFANSDVTFRAKANVNPNTFQIRSGADADHFSQAADPATEPHPAVRHLPRPIFMFVGNINEKIDTHLLGRLAQQRPDASIVLIGQLFPHTVDTVPLRQHKNLYHLGKQPFESLPGYLRAADLCLLPYAAGDATYYRSPLKLYEYLATGKPIVSTPHPEVELFGELVAIAPADQFATCTQDALAHDTPALRQARLQAARANSWDARVDAMIEKLAAFEEIAS